VDRLDPQATARRIEYLGEQGARAVLQRLDRALAERDQIRRQRRRGHPHPCGQPPVDALRHLGCACLGEGQAEDRAGIDTAQQQAEHPRRQHLGLARAGRRGQPDVRGRVARIGLRAPQPG
jgi:hypothetical protein